MLSATFPPSFEILQTSGIAQLEIAVQQGLDQPRSLCQRPLPSASQSLPACTQEESSGTALMSASNSLQQKREFPLSDFPSSLVLQNKTFTLRAVIAFRGTLCKNALGHYVAYCRRPPCIWEMYDDFRTFSLSCSVLVAPFVGKVNQVVHVCQSESGLSAPCSCR